MFSGYWLFAFFTGALLWRAICDEMRPASAPAEQ
jgi:hypothetical protein